MKDSIIEFDEFINETRKHINGYLNIVLRICILVGPICAVCLKFGIFRYITYFHCLQITAAMTVLSIVHYILTQKYPYSDSATITAIVGIDIFLLLLNTVHFGIYLSWCIVPILSLLYANKKTFLFASCFNYAMMLAAIWITSPYYASLRSDDMTAMSRFIGIALTYTLESILIFFIEYLVLELSINHMKELHLQFNSIKLHEADMQEKMDILDSMAEIYDNVNLINFINSTEMSLRDDKLVEHPIDMSVQDHTKMTQRLRGSVMPDQIDSFWKFTTITTVRARLTHKKLISAEFIDIEKGWFRAQYIAVDSTPDGIPNIVIYTTRNIDEEKKREENLIRISMTDELTRLFNRRCYDEDISIYRKHGLNSGFVLFSVDVNGLKAANDTKGHAAGDELIKGAADCLASSVGSKGKVYRTGGDEFLAIVHTDTPEDIISKIKSKSNDWHGAYVDKLSMSIGYAAYCDNEDATIDDLERIADSKMYEDKERYYRESGTDRRK
ncbi:MAG: GGDEF domain-containing protein [Pseudobutyrivibrio sp.]|nr:GGDEF domain-containing protein [Pseudobutyrivibrio sp.]